MGTGRNRNKPGHTGIDGSLKDISTEAARAAEVMDELRKRTAAPDIGHTMVHAPSSVDQQPQQPGSNEQEAGQLTSVGQ